ncbi:type II toxin-antitoxin system RelE/ParE family toxin [Herbaspirillum sp. AP02]|uniref:type II toxin-antitoxin system RelE/ParE family toxin n=1 Tax=unclassified Herbaspirillum TaxID=2624150 RepID=UPI0015DB247D|nr:MULTISPECIES: type II toxin-antitoxin system RelE/ParE family toxin [unclassified Herbaspirillum]MBG7618633.1 type II toxin-antitoxin system RelE/ParE family toxin [Herbaspirillum sp. AP02]NZD67565.1 type II toxin-antitoxin system RelE/ParE family toxin [Herbaspirillum sp. AP21]
MIELLRYQRADGHEPVSDWLSRLRDERAQARIRIRLRQVQAGNFGDCESVGDGVAELRIHVGAGYRVYFGRHGKSVVILLCGGDKRSQQADIKLARQYWMEWKGRQK